jgi:hypothetical protein
MFWIINGPDAALGYPEFSGAGHRRTDSRDGKIRLSGTVTVRQAITNGPRASAGEKGRQVLNRTCPPYWLRTNALAFIPAWQHEV